MRKPKFSKQKLFEMFFDAEQGVSIEKMCRKHNISISTASRVRSAIKKGRKQNGIARYILKTADEYLKTKRPLKSDARLSLIILKHNYFLRKQRPQRSEKYYLEKLGKAFDSESEINKTKVKQIINYENEFKFLKNVFPNIIKRIQQTGDLLEMQNKKGSKPEANHKPKKTGKKIKNVGMIDRFVAAWKTIIKKINCGWLS